MNISNDFTTRLRCRWLATNIHELTYVPIGCGSFAITNNMVWGGISTHADGNSSFNVANSVRNSSVLSNLLNFCLLSDWKMPTWNRIRIQYTLFCRFFFIQIHFYHCVLTAGGLKLTTCKLVDELVQYSAPIWSNRWYVRRATCGVRACVNVYSYFSFDARWLTHMRTRIE